MPPVPFWWPSLTRDRMSPAVCEIANCRTGVSARTPADTRMTATASTAPARSPAGCCRSRSLPGPATRKCSLTAPRTPWSHADITSSPLSARLAPAEYPAIIQATSSGRGVVSRARIRSRPSSAGSTELAAARSVRRRISSRSRSRWVISGSPAGHGAMTWPGRCGF